MLKHSLIAGAALLSMSLFAQDNLINQVKDNGSADGAGYNFETIVDIEATSVKNQGRSGTCWSYATTSFIESEMIKNGAGKIDISEMFTVRMVYLDKAEKYVRLHGNLNFGQGGALPDVIYVIKKYGAVPQEVYAGLNYGTEENNHGEMEASLKGIIDAVVANKNGTVTPNWKIGFNAILDAYLGEYPESFEYNGKTYTPRSFADDVMKVNADDYIQFTSFTHYPFNEKCQIQVPDNWAWGDSYNVELDQMIDVINTGLDKGYTVSWATDVSEKGFSLKNGLVIVPEKAWKDMTAEERTAHFTSPHPEMEITQENRQAAYNNYSTQDDHGMQITGRVKDQNGTIYYMVKNSWGDRENDYKTGYLYVSESFMRYKTISVMLNKDGVDKKVLKTVGFNN